MPIVPLEFDFESSPGRYGVEGGGRLINCYGEFAGEKAKAPFPIYPVEGLASFSTLTNGGPCRGAISLSPYGYIVSGIRVFRVDGGGSATEVTGVFPGTDPVFMARNRKSPNAQIALVSQGLRYILENNVLTSISDTDLPNANSVTAISGYFVFSIEDGRFFWTTIDEGTAIDALDFASAEANPDGLLVAEARAQEIIFFGPNSIEFWSHTGATALPFERASGTTIQNLGLLCQHSVRDLNGVKFFVASDGTVRQLDGYSPTRISTHAVERDIDSVATKTSITAFAYSYRGHQFYVLNAPMWTWVYDGLTQKWHERQSYQADRWRAEVFVDINGQRIVGDYAAGTLYKVDAGTYTEANDHLVMTVRSAPMHGYPAEVGINRLFVDTVPGVGLNSADDALADPELMLRVSKTGGKTWGNQRTASIGQIGEYGKQVKFESIGQSGEDGVIYELSMSAAVQRGIAMASAEVELLEP